MNYLIAGFSGAGKTYLLEELKGHRAFHSFIKLDLDHEIARLLNIKPSSLGEWIREKGMDEFRKLEFETLETILERDHQIIALGGGSYTEKLDLKIKENKNAEVCHLSTSFEICWERISNDSNRPLVQLGREELEKIYQKRAAILHKKTKISEVSDFIRFVNLSE